MLRDREIRLPKGLPITCGIFCVQALQGPLETLVTQSSNINLSPREFSIVPRYPSGVTIRRKGRLVIYYPHAIVINSTLAKKGPLQSSLFSLVRARRRRSTSHKGLFTLQLHTKSQLCLDVFTPRQGYRLAMARKEKSSSAHMKAHIFCGRAPSLRFSSSAVHARSMVWAPSRWARCTV